jgi:hypothetical protein
VPDGIRTGTDGHVVAVVKDIAGVSIAALKAGARTRPAASLLPSAFVLLVSPFFR